MEAHMRAQPRDRILEYPLCPQRNSAFLQHSLSWLAWRRGTNRFCKPH